MVYFVFPSNAVFIPKWLQISALVYVLLLLISVSAKANDDSGKVGAIVKGTAEFTFMDVSYPTVTALCQAVSKSLREKNTDAGPTEFAFLGATDNGYQPLCKLKDDKGEAWETGYGERKIVCPQNSAIYDPNTLEPNCLCNKDYQPKGAECVEGEAKHGPLRSEDAAQIEETSRSLDPKDRGNTNEDDDVLRKTAKELHLYILLRESNRYATQYIGKRNFRSKPMELKAKTLQTGLIECRGLAAADPSDPVVIKMLAADNMSFDEYKLKLKELHFIIDENTTIDEKSVGVKKCRYLIKHDPSGDMYYGDYDLHGVYDEDGTPWSYEIEKTPRYSDDPAKNPLNYSALMDFLNTKFKAKVINHGTQDDWLDRMKGPLNKGPQPPVTAYLPTGKVERIPRVGPKGADAMKVFYTKHKLPWAYEPEF